MPVSYVPDFNKKLIKSWICFFQFVFGFLWTSQKGCLRFWRFLAISSVAPLTRDIALPPQGAPLTRSMYTSIALSKFWCSFALSITLTPLQEPFNVDGMNRFECPFARQPFMSLTLFNYGPPLCRVVTTVHFFPLLTWRSIQRNWNFKMARSFVSRTIYTYTVITFVLKYGAELWISL